MAKKKTTIATPKEETAAPVEESGKVTTFTGKVADMRKEYDDAFVKFEKINDPIERYMWRQKMKDIQSLLEKEGVKVELP